MTIFIESAYSLAFMFVNKGATEFILPTEFEHMIRSWQRKANELNIDVVFKNNVTNALFNFSDYFRVDSKCRLWLVDGKTTQDCESYFISHIPESALNIMNTK